MKKSIMPFNWEAELDNVKKVYSIGNDFFLIDNPAIVSAFDYPFKINMSAIVICTKGYMKGSINLNSYVSQAPCITVLLQGQILQYEHISEDFSGFFLIMSEQFANNLMINVQERLSLNFAFANNPCLPLSKDEMESLLDYYDLLKKTRRIADLSVRREMVKHLTLAFYYALTYQSHILSGNAKQPKEGILLDRFMRLVQENFREHRDIGFYADKLGLTPKYLSKIIRDNSGASAGEWIDNYIVLEAKAMLKSTNMTIQQISDELNFPSQSFFGKYFKRVVGVSPKSYRGK
ncbi:MAG: helix-turn-helix domain-containing protein [Tannerella sp.]|nr:helix-turn-helix domain-containing protein [Tannerella sp.]